MSKENGKTNDFKMNVEPYRKTSLFRTNTFRRPPTPKKVDDFDFEYILSSAARADIKMYRNIMLSHLRCFAIANQSEQNTSQLIYIAQDVGKWLLRRYDGMNQVLKSLIMSELTDNAVLKALDNYHWILLDLVNDHAPDEEIDYELWKRFAVNVEGKQMDGLNELHSHQVREMKVNAASLFKTELNFELTQASAANLVETFYSITDYSTGGKLWRFIWPCMLDVIDSNELSNVVIPKMLLLSATAKKRYGTDILTVLLEKGKGYISIDAADLALEFTSHIDFGCALTVLESCKDLITPEGLFTSLLVVSLKGNEAMLAVLKVVTVERLKLEVPSQLDFFNLPEVSSCTSLTPIIYLLMAVASESSHSRIPLIPDLVDLYSEEIVLQILEKGGIKSAIHHGFVVTLFNMTCTLSHGVDLISLIDLDWAPADISASTAVAVQLGHQSIVHILLESLLAPDPCITFEQGAIPILFRKSSTLRILPLISRRFPSEAAWFLGQMSDIPLPLCVPPSTEQEPVIRSRPVKGIRLGSTTLEEIIKPVDDGTLPNDRIWTKLTFEGQLRKASAKISDEEFETESVICIAPDILLTEPAYRENGSLVKQTNSVVRLISSGEETIILTPVIQSLVEFHWKHGNFWVRFAVQFVSMILFIVSNALLYFQISIRDYPTYVVSYNSIGFEIITITMSFLFLLQEVRQFLDDKGDYVTSGTNLLDVTIHLASIYIVIADCVGILSPPLLMSCVVLLSSYRLLLYLRIFPSVGPIVRITTTALGNVLPILVPMGILILAYTAAFFIVHQGIIGPTTNYSSFWSSLQNTLTMFTYDYSVLRFPNIFSVFITRILFHATFLICFVNLIVALMTVNVVSVVSNMRNAWLVEVSDLLVELEIYWPFPYTYTKRNNRIRLSYSSLGKPTPQEEVEIGIVLYTAPKARVAKTSWYTNYPKHQVSDDVKNGFISRSSTNSKHSSRIPMPSNGSFNGNPFEESKLLSSKVQFHGSTPLRGPTSDDAVTRIPTILKSSIIAEESGSGVELLMPTPAAKRIRSIIKRDLAHDNESLSSSQRMGPQFIDSDNTSSSARLVAMRKREQDELNLESKSNFPLNIYNQQTGSSSANLEKLVKFELRKNTEVLGRVEMLLQDQLRTPHSPKLGLRSQNSSYAAEVEKLAVSVNELNNQLAQLRSSQPTVAGQNFGAQQAFRSVSVRNVKQVFPR